MLGLLVEGTIVWAIFQYNTKKGFDSGTIVVNGLSHKNVSLQVFALKNLQVSGSSNSDNNNNV